MGCDENAAASIRPYRDKGLSSGSPRRDMQIRHIAVDRRKDGGLGKELRNAFVWCPLIEAHHGCWVPAMGEGVVLAMGESVVPAMGEGVVPAMGEGVVPANG
jgi:hypothetical protein